MEPIYDDSDEDDDNKDGDAAAGDESDVDDDDDDDDDDHALPNISLIQPRIQFQSHPFEVMSTLAFLHI